MLFACCRGRIVESAQPELTANGYRKKDRSACEEISIEDMVAGFWRCRSRKAAILVSKAILQAEHGSED
ncbi:predicted protein [Plenodomus lingam JN3]|uniref:Predicted protein n=1 Tax=Leptosphaeria maculans (strain JN3 / isolate v23.1.3 / race Av1-4-5-6-7-8) TaxID=985895 RepID=E4ZJF7_LEPMJ|nr:predicted protein [Plenodomus lingam JN3]CBX91588.1 predicted protein [Plenodomus lingam JN3]